LLIMESSMSPETISQFILCFILGIGAGISFLWVYHRIKLGGYKTLVKEIIQKAEDDATKIRKTTEMVTKQNQLDQQRELEQVWQVERRKIQREEDRLKQREDKLEGRMNLVEKKLSDIEKREALINARN